MHSKSIIKYKQSKRLDRMRSQYNIKKLSHNRANKGSWKSGTVRTKVRPIRNLHDPRHQYIIHIDEIGSALCSLVKCFEPVNQNAKLVLRMSLSTYKTIFEYNLNNLLLKRGFIIL